MLLKLLYQHFYTQLQTLYSKDEAAKITAMVFEWVDHIKRADVLMYPEKVLSEAVTAKINEALSKLLEHIPVQYVTSEAWFYQLKFKVAPGVLIPRPETEELVEEVLNFINKNKGSTVLDIGTGSGCIPVAIKHNALQSAVTAIDISEAALAIARENALLHHTQIDFLQLDFLQENEWNKLNEYDVIVSNPPYIPATEILQMDKNVAAHEPHSALFVPDKTPVVFYEKIATFAQAHLKKDGKIFVETHEDFAKEVAALFDAQNFTTEIKKDMFDKERMVMAIRYQ